MSAKPKPIDPYARMDGPVVSRQLIDDLQSASPSPEAQAWLSRSIRDADGAPTRSAAQVLADLGRLIDRVEGERDR